MKQVWWVSNPSFTARVETVDGAVTEAAPILRWAVGLEMWYVLDWMKKKFGSYEVKELLQPQQDKETSE